jgi:hypothetical protein
MHRQKVADRDILNNLAWLYHHKDENRALELAEEAYLLVPKNPGILGTLGLIPVHDGIDTARRLKILRDTHALISTGSER